MTLGRRRYFFGDRKCPVRFPVLGGFHRQEKIAVLIVLRARARIERRRVGQVFEKYLLEMLNDGFVTNVVDALRLDSGDAAGTFERSPEIYGLFESICGAEMNGFGNANVQIDFDRTRRT